MKATLPSSPLVVYAATVAIFAGGIGVLAFSQAAGATVKFATDTGKGCGDCHVSASGGGKLTPFGEKFKANGNKLP